MATWPRVEVLAGGGRAQLEQGAESSSRVYGRGFEYVDMHALRHEMPIPIRACLLKSYIRVLTMEAGGSVHLSRLELRLMGLVYFA